MRDYSSMKFKLLAGAVIAGAMIALVGPVSCLAADSTIAERSEIRAALEKWTKDFNARDTSQVCSLFAPDLISNYQGQPQGNFNSLCTQLKKSVSDPATSYHYALDLKEIIVSGDMAVVRLEWTLKMRRQNQSKEMTIVEPGLDVFRREPDGMWRIARFVAYSASGT